MYTERDRKKHRKVVIIFVTRIPQTLVPVHKTDQFTVVHGSLIKLNKLHKIQCTKTPKTDVGHTKKSNLFERLTVSDDVVHMF